MRTLFRSIFFVLILTLLLFFTDTRLTQATEPCDLACTPIPRLVKACESAGGTFTCCGCVFN